MPAIQTRVPPQGPLMPTLSAGRDGDARAEQHEAKPDGQT